MNSALCYTGKMRSAAFLLGAYFDLCRKEFFIFRHLIVSLKLAQKHGEILNSQ